MSAGAAAPLEGPARRVGFLLVDGFALMSYAAAAGARCARPTLLAGRTLYALSQIPAAGRARRPAPIGAVVGATDHVGERVDFDLVIVVAGGRPDGLQTGRERPRVAAPSWTGAA